MESTTTKPEKVLIESQFVSLCQVCQKVIPAGSPTIFFVETGAAIHEDCDDDEYDGTGPQYVDGKEFLRMDAREKRGKQIALKGQIKRKGDHHYIVPSQTRGSKASAYVVDLATEEGPTCNCPDHEEHGRRCKHIHAVEWAILMEQTADEDGTAMTITRVARTTYKQQWRLYNKAQTNERDHFAQLLRGLCEGITQPRQSTGRPRHHLADVIFSLVWRAYCEKSLRRMMSELREFCERGFIETAPHFNTLSDYDKRSDITPLLKLLVEESALPLRAVDQDFAADSTGFATSRFGRWFDEKYGRERTGREWVKLHAMVGVKTHAITACEVTRGFGGDTADSSQFEGLVRTTGANFDVREISADKAYLGKRNLASVIAIGGTPYVPFKVNSSGGEGATLWNRLYHYYQYRREEFLKHYHKRSNVETAFAMVKAKFGDSLRSKTDVGQVNELLCRALAHNLCCLVMSIYELGITPQFWQQGQAGAA